MNSEFLKINDPVHSKITIHNSLFVIKSRLSPHTSTPSLDAQVLLAHIIGQPRAWLLAHPEVPLSSYQFQQLKEALQRLESGFPLPYLLGEWEFCGLKFKVTPDTLIPRPETELLVETALRWLNQEFLPRRRKENSKEWLAVDVGTGTGCIAISLAIHCPELHIIATDLSPSTLKIAHQNAQMHKVTDRITFLEADLLDPQYLISNTTLPSDLFLSPSNGSVPTVPIGTSFHLIAANLPYIPTSTLHTLEVYGREPTLALEGGPDGLILIRRLLSQAATHLVPGGLMLLEIEATQGEAASALARQHFPDAHIQVKPDLAGHDRLLMIQTPSETSPLS